MTSRRPPRRASTPQVGPIRFEHPPESTENTQVSAERGTKTGTGGDESGFADAVAAIMRLPLSDAEKAEAVRRLMRGAAASSNQRKGRQP